MKMKTWGFHCYTSMLDMSELATLSFALLAQHSESASQVDSSVQGKLLSVHEQCPLHKLVTFLHLTIPSLGLISELVEHLLVQA